MKQFLLFYFFIFNYAFALNCNKSSIYNSLSSLKSKCSQKKVHLTFDDGPDPKVTPKLLKGLNARGVKSSFYISTHNLKAGRKNQTLINMVKSGHVVASHGHHHHAHDLRLTKKNGKYYCLSNNTKEFANSSSRILTAEESQAEIEKSFELLNQVTGGLYYKQKHQLFRFPYGRGALPSRQEVALINRYGGGQNACKYINGSDELPESTNYSQDLREYRQFRSEALQRVHNSSHDHVGWNFDSRDSVSSVVKKAKQDPYWYKKNIIQRLCENKNDSIMALFHDKNKSFNAQSMGDIIDIGRCLGIEFVSYDEIVKDREKLAKNGVLQEAPRADALGDFIKEVMTQTPEHGKPPVKQCNEQNKQQECESKLSGRFYQQCQGEQSICVYGSWIAKSNIKEVGRYCPQLYRKCYSEYAKKEFSHCQGRKYICIDGEWLAIDNPVVGEYCQ